MGLLLSDEILKKYLGAAQLILHRPEISRFGVAKGVESGMLGAQVQVKLLKLILFLLEQLSPFRGGIFLPKLGLQQ